MERQNHAVSAICARNGRARRSHSSGEDSGALLERHRRAHALTTPSTYLSFILSWSTDALSRIQISVPTANYSCITFGATTFGRSGRQVDYSNLGRSTEKNLVQAENFEYPIYGDGYSVLAMLVLRIGGLDVHSQVKSLYPKTIK